MNINNSIQLATKPADNLCQPSQYQNRYGLTFGAKSLTTDTVSFTGKKVNKLNRKAFKRLEEQLREIDDTHDPYSDVIMIPKRKLKRLKEKVKNRPNAESMVKLLSGYTQHMFPNGEARVFDLLAEETRQWKKRPEYKNGNFDFHDILQEHLPDAKPRLVSGQFKVLDNIREYSQKNLNKQERALVEKRVKKLEDDIIDDKFRIKASVGYLEELYGEIGDKRKVKDIIKYTYDFPNGATSVDAFIVKNADKSHEEIAVALVEPSLNSLEHIHVQSKGGETKGDNLIAASKRMNNLRGSMEYEDFIERFPEIPKCTQRHVDDLVKKINRGGIPDIAYNLPGVKEQLAKESKGLINIDISHMKSGVFERIDGFKEKINSLVGHFNGI